MVYEKNCRVSLSDQELCHPRDILWILAAIPVCRNTTGLSRSIRSTRTWHGRLMGIYPARIFPFSSLTVAWCCRSWWRRRAWGRCRMMTLLSWKCHWCWMNENWRTNLLADKPGTKIGTKFSMLNWIRIPFWMRCGFWPLIHSSEYQFSSQSFPSDNTAGVLSRTFIVKNIPNSLTYKIASSCVCTSPLAVIDYRRTARFGQSFHFSITQVFFADHVHWRSGVDNKFSFLRFKSWCRQAPIIRRRE